MNLSLLFTPRTLQRAGVLLLFLLYTSLLAQAQTTITVTSTANSGSNTLRAAITTANAGSGSYLITLPANQTISLTSALPDLAFSGTITSGSTLCPATGVGGTAIVRTGALNFRLLTFAGSANRLTLSNLQLQNGRDPDEIGGAINSRVASNTLIVSSCLIKNNAAGLGGGIALFEGTAIINQTFFDNNTGSLGSSMSMYVGATARLTTCTIRNDNIGDVGMDISGSSVLLINNTITGGAAAGNGSSGIRLRSISGPSSLSVIHSTFTMPTVRWGIEAEKSTNATSLYLQNNVFGPTNATFFVFGGTSGTLNSVSGGGNVFTGNATAANISGAGFTPISSDKNNVGTAGLGLSSLTTGDCLPTIPLLPGSVAINAGVSTTVATDARGVARVGAPDAGAFESRGFTLALTSGNSQSTTVGTAFANPLWVTVSSSNSEPVNGGVVTYTGPGSGASINPASVTASIASGIAGASVTANATTGGPYTVAAIANGASPTVNFSLTNTPAAPTIAGFNTLDNTVCVGSPIQFTATVGNVSPPYAFTLSNGTSTTMGNAGSTAFSQNLTAAGNGPQTFTLTVSDGGPSATSTTTVTVNALPTATLTNNGPLTCSQTSVTLTASGGSSYTFTSPGGAVLGTSGATTTRVVSSPGSYSVRVGNASGCVSTTSTTVMSNTAVVTVSNPATSTVNINQPFSQSFTATGGASPYSFSIATGTLPTGLSLATTGVLSGTPTQSGSFTITVRGTDANGCSGVSATYTLSVQEPFSAIRYVKPAASGNGSGSSWTNASSDLQSQINLVGVTQVWVATGTYKPTTGTDRTISFVMKNGVEIYGGFVGTETTLNQRPAVNPVAGQPGSGQPSSSTLSGEIDNSSTTTDNSYHVVNNAGVGITSTAVLDGFVITGGNANGSNNAGAGGGMLNVSASPTVRNCSFQGNSSIGDGGGMYNVTNSNPSLINCSFQGNTANGDGGGMSSIGSISPSLTNCSFRGNTASGSGSGGGMYNLGANTILTNCSFQSNTAQFGGGMWNSGANNAVLTNCSFQGNTAGNGGGMFNNGANTTLANCVLFGNGGNNTLSGSGTVTLRYSLIEASENSFTDGGNNLTTTVSPFVSTTSTQLNGCAPAINAGLTSATGLSGVTTDLAGNPRVFGGTVDMGAYEYQAAPNPGLTVTNPSITTATVGSAFSQTFTASGGVLSYSFVAASGSLPGSLSLNTTTGVVSGTPTESGSYSITVRATDANGCSGVSATYTLVVNAAIPTVAGLAATPNPACVGSPLTFTATIGNVTGSYNYTLTNGSSTSIAGSSSNTSFSQNLTASGSGAQSFTLTVSANSQTASLMTSVMVTNSPDYQPLVDLYNATGGANWTNKTGWLSGCDPCTGNGGQPWFGLGCSSGRVSRISLFQNNLVGSLPASLSGLTGLLTLQINGNAQLGGNIPAGLGSLTGLVGVELDNNALTGTIPGIFTALTNLQTLVLNNNQLTGTIPTSLSALTNLQAINLNNNQLTGTIPGSFTALTNLQRLFLSTNQLTGTIPPSLSALTNLQVINLSNNQLTGTIPNLSTLTSLQSLLLGNNRLTGTIPGSFTALTNLQRLDLSTNQLTGTIPPSLSALTSLQTLSLAANQLTGCFPASLSALCGGGRAVSFSNNPGLPGGGDFTVFCASGFGSDGFMAQASASQPAVCTGSVVSLSANGGSGYNYSWLAPAGATLSSTSSQLVSATLTTAGVQTFTVVVSSGSTCSSMTTVSVTGNALPTAGLSSNGPLTCSQTSVTLTASGGSSYTFTSPDGAVLGTSGATTTRVVSSPGTYSVTVANASGCVSSTSTTVISNTAVVTVSNPATTTVNINQPFSQTFTPSGGASPYSYSISSGSLPTGLSLASSGVLSGTPTQGGSFTLVVRGTDANGCFDLSSPYVLTVNVTPTITGFSTLANTVCVGSPITFTATIGNISGNYGWSLSNGGPPVGSPGPATVTSFSVVQTASGTGVQTFTLTVTSGGQSATAITSVTVNSLPTATLTKNGPLSCAVTSVTLTASGGNSYTFANGSGTVLPGSGNTRSVTASGTYSVTVANASGCVSTTSTTVISTTATVTVTNPTTTTGTQGAAFGQSFTASGGTGPYSFSLASGSLPTGLSLNTTTGVVSGTPTESGSYSITVRATDANGCSGVSATYTLVVNAAIPTVAGLAATPNPACVGSPLTFTATIGNVTGSYNYTLTNGSSTSIAGSSSNTSFSQNLTASGSGAQSFTLTVSANNQTASLMTSVMVTNSPDYQPLVDLYNATNGANWTNKTGWLSGCDPCTGNGGQPWFGLTCTNGRVSRISLYQNNLVGSLPGSLSALTGLTTLQINANPQLGGTIPTGLGSLTGLVGIEFDNNALTGTIPSSITALTNLQLLRLTSNQLSGSIPSLSGLTNLQFFYLDGNQLMGSIPSSLSGLTSLQTLDLNTNQLSGSIPSLSGLTSLQTLDLNNNQLTGTIPSSLSVLTNLQFLYLDGNQLTGTIPSSLSALTNLERLYLSNNQLTGTIPSSLNGLTNLVQLILSNNQLAGSIPAGIGALTGLQDFRLDGNQLTGCFPTSLSALCGGGRTINFGNNPGLPGGGDFAAFCASGVGSDGFLAQAAASLSAVCTGGVVSLSANGGAGYTYTWLAPPGATLSSTISQTTSASLTTSGVKTFTVVVSSGSSCSSTATISVTGNALPTAGLSSNGPLTCSQTSVTLTASGGSSYTFTSPGGGVLGTSGATTTRVVSSPGSYSVRVGNANGCVSTTSTTVSSNTATVTVNSPATSTVNINQPFSQTFTASGGVSPYSYSISSGSLPTGLSLASSGVLSGTPTQGGSFTLVVRGQDANGCFGLSSPYVLRVNATPTITGFTTLDNTVCVGSSIQFTATVGNVTGSYNFTLTNGTSSTVSTATGSTFSQNLTAAGSNSQSFTLTVGDNGFTATATTTVTVNPLPIPTVTVNFGGTLTCAQTSLTITASGGTYYQFERQGGGGIVGTSGAVPDGMLRDGFAIVNASGVYSVTVNNSNTGCFSTTSITIYNTTAVVTTTNPATNTVAVNTPFSQTFTATGGVSPYSFSIASGTLPTGLSLTNTGVLSGTPTQGGSFTITVRGTDANGCSELSSAYVLTVNATPTIAGFTTLDNTVCVGSPIQFTATVGNVTGTYNFTLTNGTSSTVGTATGTAFSQNLTAAGSGPQTFTLTVGDNGFTATATNTVTVNALPTAMLVSSGTLTCAQTSVTLTASGGTSYTFTAPGGTVLTGSGNTRTVSSPGAYSVTVANVSGCVSTTSTTVFSNTAVSTVSINPSSVTLTCASPTASLMAVGSGTVRWSTGETTPVITVNAAGTYSVTLTNSSGCIATASTSVFSNTAVPSVSINPSSATLTCASPTASLTAVGSGSVLWSTGETTPVISVNAAGTYSVTLTNGSGCVATASTSVFSNTAVSTVSINPSSATLTCASPTASLTAIGSGTVRWSTGETTPVISINAAGTYSVTLTNGSGCVSTSSTSVFSNTAVSTVSISPSSATLTCASPTASLTAIGSGTVRWSTGETTPVISVNAAATYSVTLTNSSGCVATASTSVFSNTAVPTVSISPSSVTLTCASPTASLTAVGSGRVLWSTGETTPVISVNAAGTYSVTLTNGSGCVATASTSVFSNTAVSTVSINPSSATLTCASPTASLTAVGSGTVRWSTGETTPVITVNAAATYSVTLTNGSGCVATASTSVFSNTAVPSVSISPSSATLTCTSPTASLTAVGSGSVLWSTGETTPVISVNAAGTYSVTLTNGSGCVATASTTVFSATAVPTVSISPSNVTLTCASSTASLTAIGSGTVRWSTGETTPVISVNAAATYSVTLTNGSGCVATASTTVFSNTAVPTVSISPSSVTLTCASPTATLTAVGSGSVLWSTGETTPVISVNTAGTYSVTLTNGSGCVATASTSVFSNTAVPTVSINPSSVTLTCASPTASLTAVGSGSVLWSTGETTPVITVNTAGTYSVTLANGSGCVATASTSVFSNTAVPTVSISPSSVTLTCASPTASLTAVGSGSVLWSTGETTPVISVNTAGTYSVTLTNGSGCVATASTSVFSNTAVPTVSISPSSATLTCASPTATLTAIGSGTVRWSTGETTPVITVNAAGTYSVTLTNGSGCVATASTTVFSNTAVSTVSISPSSVTLTCASPTASLTAIGSGTVRWSTGETTPVISVNAAGTYSVTLTNGNGCVSTASTSVFSATAVPTVSISPSSATLTCASPTASLTAVGSGSVLWSTGETTPVISVNAAGTYSVTLTNNSGCIATASTTVFSNTAVPSVSINPSSATLTCASPTASLTAIGSGSGSVLWSTGETTPVISVNAAGTYSLTLTNGSGCVATASTTVFSATAVPTVSINPSSATLTCASPTATLTAVGSGSVLWSTGETTPVISVNAAGTYSLTLTNASGCVATASTSVFSNTAVPTVSIMAAPSLTITQGQNATLTASATGTPPFSYIWSTLETTSAISVNAAGTYSLSLTGTNGCSATNSATISLTTTPVVSDPFAITSVLALDCTPVLPNRYSISFTPQYSGLNGQPISFSIANELLPTTSPGPYTLQLYTDNPLLILRATQQGSPAGQTSFRYNWLAACQASVSANTPPRVSMSLPPQSATVGVGFTYVIPAGTFTDDQTPGSLVLTAAGLPAGLTLSGYTISGSPSTTVGTPRSVTITATDPGNLSVATSLVLTLAPAPVGPPVSPGVFSITGVSLLRCTPIADRINISFAPQYAGTNGQAIAFSVVNELAPTSDPAPYSLTLYRDNPVLRLRATQTGSVGEASFDYNWLVACASMGSDNTPPRVVSPVASQTATVGVVYSVNLSNVFADQETPNNITLSASGLPAGLSLVGTAISGTPSGTGVSTITLTGSDPGSLSVSTSFILTVSAATSATAPSGVFSITGVQTVSCEVVSGGQRRLTFSPAYSGLTGQPVSFRVVNELGATNAPGPYSLNLYTDNPVIDLRATQSGTPGEVSYRYNWLSACFVANSRRGADPESTLRVAVLGNPMTGDDLVIRIEGAASQSVGVELIDSRGYRVVNRLVSVSTDSHQETLSLGNSPGGVYFLRVSAGSQTVILKVIHQ